MGLCYVCSGIPFENPPSLPPPYLKNLPGKPADPGNSVIFFLESSDPTYDSPPYGYLHWQSEVDLERSARTCSLCSLIYNEFMKNTPDTGPKPIGDYNFFVTSREKNQSGFTVWTQGDRPLVIWRVGAFGYSVEDVSSPLSGNFRGRRIRERSNDPEAKKIAKGWLQDCVLHHALCGPPGRTKPLLPTRVLDLGGSSASPTIKLLETNGSRGYYTALSYSWGPESLGFAYKTTPTNIDRYKKNIDLSKDGIPPTIVDAIELTRYMGIQYLWVDALCIRQDPNYADFNVEGLKMMDYYGNSYLTITAASSSDAYSGLFNARNPPNYAPIPYRTRGGVRGTLIVTVLDPEKENLQPTYLLLEGNTIVTRAWTLQERILSTRNIFYADDQMYWECNEHFVSEDGLLVHGRQLSTNTRTQDLSLFDGPHQTLWERWDLLVALYAGREMKDPDQNKFMAICGLAKRFGQLFRGGIYHAGLWKHRLIQQLFWTVSSWDPEAKKGAWRRDWPPAPKHYRAPSWSWAVLDIPIVNPDGRIYGAELYANHENSSITPVLGDLFGQISYADLTIKAPMVHLLYLRTYVQQGTQTQTYDWAQFDDPAGANIAVPFTTAFDYEFVNESQIQSLDVYALVLGRDSSTSPDGVNGVNYLCVLVAMTDIITKYRRMGIVWLDEFSMGGQAVRYLDKSDYEELLFI